VRSLGALATWPVGGAAAGVLVLDRGERGDRGDGSDRGDRADGSDRPTVSLAGVQGDPERRAPWASVTKLCTALAVLVAVEEGTLDLGQPAGPPGSTVAHLLAHASGLGPDGHAVLAAPGRRRIYSNGGFELLAGLLAEFSGIAFGDYLREAVLEPVGMTGARLPSGGSPAAGLRGTLGDLLALGRELLVPTVVAPATLATATAVAFPGLSGVLPGFGRQDPCDWGLGFELRDAKRPHWTGDRCSPRTFGHFGQSGCFLWVDPDAGVACAVLTDTAFGPWAAATWPTLSDAVLAEVGRPA
jgi:CubicO group peptidase (beta-lactamase class C family)